MCGFMDAANDLVHWRIECVAQVLDGMREQRIGPLHLRVTCLFASARVDARFIGAPRATQCVPPRFYRVMPCMFTMFPVRLQGD